MSRSSNRKVSRASAPRHTCSVKSPGRDFDLPKQILQHVTIPERNDIREKGPLTREYHQRFMKQHNLLAMPKKPARMEWFQEEELARALYEIMMAETDLEIMKRQIALESDWNVKDCFRMFDISESGEVTRRQFEEVFNLMRLYPTSVEIELTLFRYDKDMDGRLSFDEFSEMVLPVDANYRDLVERRSSSKGNYARMQFFLDTTIDKLKALLQLIIATEMRCERVR